MTILESKNVIIELYEYHIKNKPKTFTKYDNRTNTSFDNIELSEDNKCNILEGKAKITDQKFDNLMPNYYSCDNIYSKLNKKQLFFPDTKSDESLIFEYLNNIYVGYPDKFFLNEEANIISLKCILNDMHNILTNLLETNIIYYRTKLKQHINYDNFNHDYIEKINYSDKNKFIIFGDFHGSFHTFYRHLHRLLNYGVIDNKLKLKDNYKLVFLGDIVDRGNFAIEILLIIMLMININKDNIVIIRGNHETPIINMRDGFYDEIHSCYQRMITLELVKIVKKITDVNKIIDKDFNILQLCNYLIKDISNINHNYNLEIKKINLDYEDQYLIEKQNLNKNKIDLLNLIKLCKTKEDLFLLINKNKNNNLLKNAINLNTGDLFQNIINLIEISFEKLLQNIKNNNKQMITSLLEGSDRIRKLKIKITELTFSDELYNIGFNDNDIKLLNNNIFNIMETKKKMQNILIIILIYFFHIYH